MRMWMVEPKLMCRNHLLGEHRELHILVGTIMAGKSLHGYLQNGLIVPTHIYRRHEYLVYEMKDRGYNHHSPLLNGLTTMKRVSAMEWVKDMPMAVRGADTAFDIDKYVTFQHKELLRRCPECSERYRLSLIS